MSKLYRLILGKNCTLANGTILSLVEEPPATTRNDTSMEEDYDAVGAMEFIVATIMVYSIFGVFCTLISKIRRTRGKTHGNSMIDESVSKYLKKENSLKFDGQKTKLRHACERVSQQIQEFEEKQALFDNERELSSEFAPANNPDSSRKKRKKKRRSKMKARSIADLIGDVEVVYLARSGAFEKVDCAMGGLILADIPEKEVCESLESLESLGNELASDQ